ncbi:hypothetical protein [Actinomadura macrotermitis]|uniref:hypothetical protein n=1 Tax=Actinomadura macrotermitis TaxID=2585200 RepID=UPI001296CE2B|nr:hypothetical protein [Actinomadura macrotermitis]
MTDDPVRAIDHVNTALASSPPGTCAVVKRVQLSIGLVPGYLLVAEVGRARRDQVTGHVVWEVVQVPPMRLRR